MFMGVCLVTEVEVLLHVDDVGDNMLLVPLEELPNFNPCHRLNGKPIDWFKVHE